MGGSLAGGGIHRGSILRMHVGTALLASGDWSEAARASWGVGNTAKGVVRQLEHPLEQAVSRHIGKMPFLWLEVDDPPGVGSDRGVIEAGAISLLSNAARPAIDPPSAGWLGRRASRALVRESGLWNVNHVEDAPSADFLDLVQRYLR